MTDYTSITVSKDTLTTFHEKKAEYYGDLADEVSNERFINDVLDEVN